MLITMCTKADAIVVLEFAALAGPGLAFRAPRAADLCPFACDVRAVPLSSEGALPVRL